MKLSPEEIEEILTRVVKSYLRRVTHIESNEDKAKEIAHMCHIGGGTDTCNLIGEFEDLSKEVFRKIGELSRINEKQINAWKDVVGNLSQDILGDEDFKVSVISEWLQSIRDTPASSDTTFLVRTFLLKK